MGIPDGGLRRAHGLVVKLIDTLLAPHLYASGYAGSESDPRGTRNGRLLIWAPKRIKRFSRNQVIKSVYAIGAGWVSDDAEGGGMCSIAMTDVPVDDLVAIYTWLLAVLPRLKGNP